jgi:response regulator RpfG family c-di-GMP phosphodiesterase
MKSSKKKRLNVLLLDDEISILKLNNLILEQDFNTFKAENIREAKRIINENEIHIVVSDHLLGSENGLNFLLELHNTRSDIIKIVFSSCLCHEVIIQSHNSDAIFRYLTKPCSNSDLLETVSLAEIAWEVFFYEEQLKSEHSSFVQSFENIDLIKLTSTKRIKALEIFVLNGSKSLLYLSVAALGTGLITLILLYGLKSLLGFDIFR